MMAAFAYNPKSGGESDEDSAWSHVVAGDDAPSVETPHGNVEESLNTIGSVAPEELQESELLANDAEKPADTMDSRAYQTEMFERSLQENVIVSVSKPPNSESC